MPAARYFLNDIENSPNSQTELGVHPGPQIEQSNFYNYRRDSNAQIY